MAEKIIIDKDLEKPKPSQTRILKNQFVEKPPSTITQWFRAAFRLIRAPKTFKINENPNSLTFLFNGDEITFEEFEKIINEKRVSIKVTSTSKKAITDFLGYVEIPGVTPEIIKNQDKSFSLDENILPEPDIINTNPNCHTLMAKFFTDCCQYYLKASNQFQGSITVEIVNPE
jgi:hypothetical protein